MTYGKWLRSLLFVVVLGLVVLSIVYKWVFIKPVYNTENLKLPSDVHTLIVGASHSATALKPEHIPGSYSVARSGEPIFYTYYKARTLLRENPHVKSVVLALSPIHISQYADNFFFRGNAGSREFSMSYYVLLGSQNDPLLPTFSSDRLLATLKYGFGVPFNYMDDLKMFVKRATGKLTVADYPFWGGYETRTENYLDKQRLVDKAVYYFLDENQKPAFSEVGEASFRRILGLGKEFNVELLVVNTPMHPTFRQEVPEEHLQAYDKLMSEELAANPSVRFYDFSQLELPDPYFLDGDHLNDQGAPVFSEKIAGLLSR